MAPPIFDEDLSWQADERMGIEVRRDSMKGYLQEAGVYDQLVKSLVRLYYNVHNHNSKQGFEGLRNCLGASDAEVTEIKKSIADASQAQQAKSAEVKQLTEQLAALRTYNFDEIQAFRKRIAGTEEQDPVPPPPTMPIQHCMTSWLKRHNLHRLEIRQKFENHGFIKFEQFLPFLPAFLMTDEIKDVLAEEKKEWKVVTIPAKDENGEEIDGETKTYYYNRASRCTTWDRPEVLRATGQDEDETNKATHKYKLFDFVDVQKDGDWYRKTLRGAASRKSRAWSSKPKEVGGYEPGYIVALNEDGTYDVQFGRREESVFEKQIMTSWDEDGNEIEVEQDVEILGDIVVQRDCIEGILKPWTDLSCLPNGKRATDFKRLKQKQRVAYMNANYIPSGTISCTPREVAREQAQTIEKFLKDLKAMRVETKDYYYSEKAKFELAIEAKKPIIRKEHYKKLNKRMKMMKISKPNRKKVAVALGVLDPPQKQMADRLPKVLMALYQVGIKDGSYAKEVEVEDQADPPHGMTFKKKVWQKVDADEERRCQENTDMGRVAHSIYGGDLKKFEQELTYRLQGITGWDMWIDSYDDFKENVQRICEEWVGEIPEPEPVLPSAAASSRSDIGDGQQIDDEEWRSWDRLEVAAFIESLGEEGDRTWGKYAATFLENEVEGKHLPDLFTNDDEDEVGILESIFGVDDPDHRDRIQDAIDRLVQQEEPE